MTAFKLHPSSISFEYKCHYEVKYGLGIGVFNDFNSMNTKLFMKMYIPDIYLIYSHLRYLPGIYQNPESNQKMIYTVPIKDWGSRCCQNQLFSFVSLH